MIRVFHDTGNMQCPTSSVTTVSLRVVQGATAGLEIATNTVANATNFFSLATKIVV